MSGKRLFALTLVFTLLFSLTTALAGANSHVIEPYTDGGQILYAGQNDPVGKVVVTNDGEYIYVEFILDADAIIAGWVITETHVHVGTTLKDFPLNRGGNPQIGLFKDSGTALEYTIPNIWDPEDKILVAAHAVIKRSDCVTLMEAPYGGSSVLNYKQGLRYDYTAVRAARSNPAAALTFTTGQNEANFFSLGFQEDRVGDEYDVDRDNSVIIIEFDFPIINGPGNDLRIIEDTWGLPYPYETADVWVSIDGLDWKYLGEANNQTPISTNHTITDFDLEDVSLDYARFVKVQDTSNRADFASRYPDQAATLDGFDLNAVVALHDLEECTTYSETAWAAGTRFVNPGNWATYFEYTIMDHRSWVQVDEVFVSAEGGTNPYGFVPKYSIDLDAGTYRLEARGTYTFASSMSPYGVADAAWNYRWASVAPGNVAGWYQVASERLQVWAGEDPSVAPVGWLSSATGLVQFNPAHDYFGYVTLDNDGRIKFGIEDDIYGDNVGGITVKVFAWQ